MIAPDAIHQFREVGFCVIRGAVARSVVDACVARLIEKARFDLDVELDRPATYRQMNGYVSLAFQGGPPFDQLCSPAVAEAFDALAGAGRWEPPRKHGFFWLSLPGIFGGDWAPPRRVGRWHVDHGRLPISSFTLSSGNCALVPIWALTDILPGGGATCGLAGSHRRIARLLAELGEVGLAELDAVCEAYALNHIADAVELTAEAGDLVVAHPLFIHAATANVRDRPRIICNTGVRLLGERRLAAADGDMSVVEQVIAESAGAPARGARRALLGQLVELQGALQSVRRAAVGAGWQSLADPEVPGVRGALFRAVTAAAGACDRTIAWTSRSPAEEAPWALRSAG